MEVDRGFRGWFARFAVTYWRREETTIQKLHRMQRIRDEEDIRMGWLGILAWAHISSCGWALVRAFLWAAWFCFSLVGVFTALVLLAFFMALVATVSCEPSFVTKQMCPFLEIRGARSGRVILSTRQAVNILSALEVFRASMESAFALMLQDRWIDYQAGVCKRINNSPLAEIQWMGVWFV